MFFSLIGHCSDFHTRQPPRGLQFTLGTPRNPAMFDTIVMANLVRLRGVSKLYTPCSPQPSSRFSTSEERLLNSVVYDKRSTLCRPSPSPFPPPHSTSLRCSDVPRHSRTTSKEKFLQSELISRRIAC